jgi:hypothetical protein
MKMAFSMRKTNKTSKITREKVSKWSVNEQFSLSAGRFACQKRAGLLLSKFTSLACGCFRGGQIFRQSRDDGAFKVIQGVQQRRKRRRFERGPVILPPERTFSILDGKTIAYERFTGVFEGSQSEKPACTEQAEKLFSFCVRFFLTNVKR